MEQPTAVDLRDYVSFELERGVWRRVFATDVVAVDVVCLEPRQSLPARTFATADVVYTVLGGTVWLVTDEAEVTLEALQAVMIPAGAPHGLRNDSPDPLILQVVISPPDEAPAPASPNASPALHAPASADTNIGPGPGLLDRLRRVLGGPGA